jgi:hypothetical protein
MKAIKCEETDHLCGSCNYEKASHLDEGYNV